MPQPVVRSAPPPGRPAMPFCVPPGSEVPWFQAIGGPQLTRQTSSTHGEDGYITVNRQVIGATVERLARKLEEAVTGFTHYELDEQAGAPTLLVVYGVTARAAREAVRRLRQQDRKVSLLVLKTLWPVPETMIRQHISGYREVVVIEMNLGQYVREIERLAGPVPVLHYGRMDGELISPATIMEVLGL
jgi:2-oxoglutarate/2-oxoacid ferredoxin oxidoreductase subunit alpha